MAKFYYQFPMDSREGKQLARFHHACIEADKKAQRYAKRMGAVGYYEDPNFFVGGVSYLEFAEPKKVNTDIWRMAHKSDDGVQWFEPNVRISTGCVKARENFIPSDLAGRVYKKEPCGWDNVRQMYSLTEWLAFVGFNSSGDKEIDANTVVGILKDKSFYTYIDIIPLAASAIGNKQSKDGAKAVRAEMERIKLPVVRTDDFYAIVHADKGVDKKADGEMATPVFFAYLESWFVGLDYPIQKEKFSSQEGVLAITPKCFDMRKIQMLRDWDNKA